MWLCVAYPIKTCYMLYQPQLRKCARKTVTGEDSSDVGEDELNGDLELEAWDHVDIPFDAGRVVGEQIMLMPYQNI